MLLVGSVCDSETTAVLITFAEEECNGFCLSVYLSVSLLAILRKKTIERIFVKLLPQAYLRIKKK